MARWPAQTRFGQQITEPEDMDEHREILHAHHYKHQEHLDDLGEETWKHERSGHVVNLKTPSGEWEWQHKNYDHRKPSYNQNRAHYESGSSAGMLKTHLEHVHEEHKSLAKSALEPVESGNLTHTRHNPETNEMDVRFNNGAIYRYQNVSAKQHADLRGAGSVGKHFNEHFRKNEEHPYELIKEGGADPRRTIKSGVGHASLHAHLSKLHGEQKSMNGLDIMDVIKARGECSNCGRTSALHTPPSPYEDMPKVCSTCRHSMFGSHSRETDEEHHAADELSMRKDEGRLRRSLDDLDIGDIIKAKKKESKHDKKMHKVMHEFYKEGSLHSGSKHGPKVTNRKQAIAIGLSEARKAAAGGYKKSVMTEEGQDAPGYGICSCGGDSVVTGMIGGRPQFHCNSCGRNFLWGDPHPALLPDYFNGAETNTLGDLNLVDSVHRSLDGLDIMDVIKGKKSMKLGRGGRAAKLKRKLAGEKGVRNPGAIIGKIGREKYGAKRMGKWSAAGRKRAKK